MGIDNLYEPRTMLEAMKNVFPIKNFLRDMFFKVVKLHETEAIDIDIVKGGRKLAPFVSPIVAGKVMQNDGFRTETFKPPYIKPKRVCTAQRALQRMPGETLYGSGMSSADRAVEILTEDLQKNEDDISRRENWMIAQALLTGKVVCKGEGIDREIDFGMPADQLPVLTSTAKWTATTTSTPITNLRSWKRIATKKGKNINVAVMNGNTLDQLMLNTAEVKGINGVFNQNQINIGAINPAELSPGVVYVGRLNESGIDVYSFDDYYTDESDATIAMIPDGKVILGSTSARAEIHYATIQDLKSGTNAVATRFPKSWEEEDPSVRYVMTQSAPLPVLHEIESFMCATVY